MNFRKFLFLSEHCLNKSQGAGGIGTKSGRRESGTVGKKRKKGSKEIETVRDSKKNRKAKMQRQKETDVETKIDPESVREKPKDRNLQRGVKNQRYTGK